MKTVLITGGSRGIGARTAAFFAEKGWIPCICARHEPERSEAVSGALYLACDITRENDVAAMKEQIIAKLHHLDALVLCAGSAWHGLIQDMRREDFDHLMSVHLTGAFLSVKYLLPLMISQGAGSIVFVSSMWGQVGASCEAAYSAAKAGQIGFAKALAKECGPSGIRVNAICPGYIPTAMNKSLPSSVPDQMVAETPLGRLGTADDCARAIYYLCSEDASFITGQILGVSGGMVI